MVVRVKEYYDFTLVFSFRKEKISAGCFLMDIFFMRTFLFPRRIVVDIVKYRVFFFGDVLCLCNVSRFNLFCTIKG